MKVTSVEEANSVIRPEIGSGGGYCNIIIYKLTN